MLAIFKSERFRVNALRTSVQSYAQRGLRTAAVFSCVLFCFCGYVGRAEQGGGKVAERAARVQQIYSQALKQFKASNDFETAWQMSRACFEWAEFATKDPERARLAQEGIDAARRAIQLRPKAGSGHHYLAMNLGQLARTRKLSALKLVDEMEASFVKATELEPKLDHASPHRSLGLLYREAPGWPISVGNKTKARQHLQKAVELCPEFPENHLALLETYIKLGDTQSISNALPAAEKCLTEAAQKFSGAEWEQSWQDWKARWEEMKEKLVSGGKRLRSPKQRA
jgi:tetratricopeptide (TPR) repeat protein